MKRRAAFSIIELLVVISIIILLLGILLPALMGARRSARISEAQTRIKSFGQGMATYAKSNNEFLPGLTGSGGLELDNQFGSPYTTNDGTFPIARFAALLSGSFVEPKHAINPIDPECVQAKPGDTDSFGLGNLSWAMLRLQGSVDGDPVRQAWSNNVNPQAPLMSDRNRGGNPDSQISSVWTELNKGSWQGAVLWGDQHASFEQGPTLATSYPGFMDNSENPSVAEGDHLFKWGESSPGAGGQDAFMCYKTANDDRNQRP